MWQNVRSIVVAGDALLLHHESATQQVAHSTLRSIGRVGNWQRFAELWAPTFERSLRADMLRGRTTYRVSRRPRLAITVTHD